MSAGDQRVEPLADLDEPIWSRGWTAGYTSGRARGYAEGGRRQATEGWEREWSYQTTAGITFPVAGDDLLRARASIAVRAADGMATGQLLSRLVGPWEPAATQSADSLAPSLIVPTRLGGEPTEQPEGSDR